ncbi:hypothetical protein JMJ56_28830 [Belnapia sp. T18]|uniref:Uncharacterized protein n=1 Tax=Belnapia arida TaxID=2804533 RepID=A0ABS1UBF7_9PROT|nr:hypothetical protein [Belnapia arida]MBL6081989.1 hypothetical protein [Belnapia arida]
MWRHVMVFSVASAGLLLVRLLAARILFGFDGSGMGLHGWIAMILGVVLTSGLAVALMAAVFAFDRTGQDARAAGRSDARE